eukprot:6860233-Prymnesium_polylepis.1
MRLHAGVSVQHIIEPMDGDFVAVLKQGIGDERAPRSLLTKLMVADPRASPSAWQCRRWCSLTLGQLFASNATAQRICGCPIWDFLCVPA